MKNTDLFFFFFLLPFFVIAQKPELGIPVGHSDAVQTVALSPDGKYALSGARDKSIKLWEAASGKLVRTWQPYRDVVTSIVVMSVAFAYTPNKQYALAASVGPKEQSILMWDLKDGSLVQSFTDKTDPERIGTPGSFLLSVSPDGKLLMAVMEVEDNRKIEGKGVKIWRIRDGHLIHTFPKQESAVTALCFTENQKFVWFGSEDGKITQWKIKGEIPEQTFSHHNQPVKALQSIADSIMVSASKNKIVTWKPETKEVIAEKQLDDAVLKGNSTALSQDGQWVVYETDHIRRERIDGKLKLVQYQIKLAGINQDSIIEMTGHTRAISAASFSADGKFALTGSHDRTLILWDLEKGKAVQKLGGFSQMLKDVALSPDKKRAAVLPRFSSDFIIWNLEKGTYSTMQGHENEVSALSFSPNGKNLLSGSLDKTLHWWDLGGDSLLHVFPKRSSAVTAVSVSPDGEFALSGHSDGIVNYWNLKKRSHLKSFSGHSGEVQTLSWSPDGKSAFSFSKNGQVLVWNLASQSKKKEIKVRGKNWSPVAFSSDGKSFINIACHDNRLEWWDIENGMSSDTFDLSNYHCATTSDIAFLPGGKRFLLSSGEDILVWKRGQKEPEQILKGHSEWVNSVKVSTDGLFGISGGYDGQMNIWDLTAESDSPLASLVMLNEEDWVIHTPSGLFDASSGGFDKLYFLVDMEIVELEQLKDRYWEPGLLPILLGLKTGSVRDVEKLALLPQYPEILAEIIPEKMMLKIDLKKRTGGIGKVPLFINQKEVEPDINPNRNKHISVDLMPYLDYIPKGEESTIAIHAYNEEGWLKSPPFELKYDPASVVTSKGDDEETETDDQAIFDDPFYTPQLHAIIVGTSEYSGDKIDLKFADEDAKIMAKALEEAGKQLFTPERIHIHLFTSDTAEEEKLSGKSNIQKAFDQVAENAHPKDVLFLFFSGHGKTIAEDFYYLTKDIASLKNLEADSEKRKQYAISSKEMMEWIRKIKANKQILVLDACHSGKATEILAAGRDLTSTQVRAMSQLKDRMGMFILASSEANQKSFETAELGQGLLTYSILLGMKGAVFEGTMAGNDKTLDVMSLFQYAANNVPDFAKGMVNKTQRPILSVPKAGGAIPIGIINEKVNIPLPPKKTIIVNSVFMEQKEFGDPIDLSVQMDEMIQKNTSSGKGQNKIFLNVRSYPDSYSIRGIYTMNGDNINVKWRLSNGTKSMGPFDTPGKKNDPEGLAFKIYQKAVEMW